MPTSEAGTGAADAERSTCNPAPSPTTCALVTMSPAASSTTPDPSPLLVRISTTDGSTRAMALTNAPSSTAMAGDPDALPVSAPFHPDPDPGLDPAPAHPDSAAARMTTANAPPQAPVSIGRRAGLAGDTGNEASVRFAGMGSPCDVTDVTDVSELSALRCRSEVPDRSVRAPPDAAGRRGTYRPGGQQIARAGPTALPASPTPASPTPASRTPAPRPPASRNPA